MATMSSAELAEQVLSFLGVKAQGQNPSADDLDLVTKTLDSVVDGLRPTATVTFALTAIPEWAQIPLKEMVAHKVAPHFGRQQNLNQWREAMADFIGGASTAEPSRPAKGRYF